MPIASDRTCRARPLLGTFVEIEVAAATGPKTDAAIDAAFDAVAEVHRLMSFQEHNSDVSRLNRDAGARSTRVHAWTFQVLEAAVEMHRRSGERFRRHRRAGIAGHGSAAWIGWRSGHHVRTARHRYDRAFT
ncbi:FAD:protein FMN transferase (plasmid) [Bradyrhizobium sp. ISRA435]|nr:FAD:protein FMN transferase [Bradyrhizobium sp. ISRA435]